jgi:hypothetical protein
VTLYLVVLVIKDLKILDGLRSQQHPATDYCRTLLPHL